VLALLVLAEDLGEPRRLAQERVVRAAQVLPGAVAHVAQSRPDAEVVVHEARERGAELGDADPEGVVEPARLLLRVEVGGEGRVQLFERTEPRSLSTSSGE